MKPTNIRKSEDYTIVTGDHKNILPPPPPKKKLPPYLEIISNCTCFMSYQHVQYRQTLLHSQTQVTICKDATRDLHAP